LRDALNSASDYLRTLAAEYGGAIPAERFMEEALYHPRFGYYARQVRSVGRGGDFSTSATMHPALGTAVAAWARRHRAEVRQRSGQWHLIELGGGTGELAESVLRALGWWPRRGLNYHLIEVSAGLRAEQQRRLQGWTNLRWHRDIEAALEAAAGQALIFSNEFADAFPCVQLRWDGTLKTWREARVGWEENSGEPVESFEPWAPLSDCAKICSALDAAQAADLIDGQRIELPLSYRRWLERWTPLLRAGRMLTLDYGDRFPALYWRRPRGTLRAYCRHQRFEGLEVYRRFGQQDLTADVNFTDLEIWGARCGLAAAGFQTQRDFLRQWLPEPQLQRAPFDPALAYLLDEDGPGGAFKALEQVKTP
jgi:SAM-dependent MidA family methyltransferase